LRFDNVRSNQVNLVLIGINYFESMQEKFETFYGVLYLSYDMKEIIDKVKTVTYKFPKNKRYTMSFDYQWAPIRLLELERDNKRIDLKRIFDLKDIELRLVLKSGLSNYNRYSLETSHTKVIYMANSKLSHDNDKKCYINSLMHEVGHARIHTDYESPKNRLVEKEAWDYSSNKLKKIFGAVPFNSKKILDKYIETCINTYR
jgi:hypothetical protein